MARGNRPSPSEVHGYTAGPLPGTEPDPSRRWARELANLHNRALKLKLEHSSTPGTVRELLDDALATCTTLLQELAGAHMMIDQATAARHQEAARWDHLFGEMLVPCVLTDGQGCILDANRSASQLLNLSCRALKERLLLHFVPDREGFQAMLRTVRMERSPQRARLVVRPRERAPVRAHVMVCPEGPGESQAWLWFFAPESMAAHLDGDSLDSHRADGDGAGIALAFDRIAATAATRSHVLRPAGEVPSRS